MTSGGIIGQIVHASETELTIKYRREHPAGGGPGPHRPQGRGRVGADGRTTLTRTGRDGTSGHTAAGGEGVA